MSVDSQHQPRTEPADPGRPAAPAGRLLRVLGVGFGLAVAVGGTIGMGILRTPGEVAAHLPQPGLFLGVWVAGGVYALLGAVSVAELGTLVPRSGGFYVFARRAFGPYPAFVVGWTDWLNTCGSTAAVAMVLGDYAIALCGARNWYAPVVALLTVAAVALLQWRGVRWGSRAQGVTSVAKAVAFLVLVACCFLLGRPGASDVEPAAPVRPLDVSLVTAILLAFQGVIYTYDGWYGPVYFGEEVRRPARDIPRSMVGGILLVIAVYLLVNLALLFVLPMSRIADNELAVGTAAEVVFGGHGGTAVAVLALVSLAGTVNAFILVGPRVLFAMGRDGLFVREVTAVNPGGTPSVALLLTTLAACVFIVSGTFEQVLAVLAFLMVANYAAALAAVFVLRWREPGADRPYRAWGYPWTTAVALVASVAFLAAAVASDRANSLVALALLVASYPVFVVLQSYLRPSGRTDAETPTSSDTSPP